MTEFQIVIVSPEIEEEAQDEQPPSDAEGIDEAESKFDVRQNSRAGKKTVAKIDELANIWDVVVDKLTTIAAKTRDVVEKSPYELDTIEFNIGIEAGLEIGLVTKGNASVSIAFRKK